MVAAYLFPTFEAGIESSLVYRESFTQYESVEQTVIETGRDSITDSNQLGKRDSLSTSTSFVCVHRHHLMNLVGRTFRSNKESNLEISLSLYVLCVSVLILKLYSVDMYTTKAASNENKKTYSINPADKMASIQSRQQRP